MKKKLTVLSFLMMSLSGMVKAQDYYQGIGAVYNNAMYDLAYTTSTTNYSGTTGVGVPGLIYKATLNLVENINVSAYPSLGISLSPVDRRFGFSLPINAEYYLGDIEENFIQVGGGIGYHFLSSSSVFGTYGGPVIGPEAALSGQFYYQGNPIFIRAGFTYGMNKSIIPDAVISKDSKYLISLSLIYPIGL